MVQRFSTNKGLVENDHVVDKVKRHYLDDTRKAFDEVLASGGFAQAIKDEQVFLVLRRINNRTIDTDIDLLIETLRTFGTPLSYDKLAELCFSGYLGTTLSQSGVNEINIDVQIGAQRKSITTQDGKAITTNNPDQTINKKLIAIARANQQEKNDFEFLCHLLAPHPRIINIIYNGVG